jgi:tetratricopeptide (TPR) repeat protein
LPARLRVAEAQLREDPRRATPDIDWLKQNASRDPSARLLIGRHHRRLSRPEEAARVLDELLDGDPNHVPALVERARVAMDLNQASAAERWLERALDLDAQNRDVNVAMADCLRLLSRIEEAERFQKRAKEIEDRLQKQLDDMRKDKGKEQGTKAVT